MIFLFFIFGVLRHEVVASHAFVPQIIIERSIRLLVGVILLVL